LGFADEVDGQYTINQKPAPCSPIQAPYYVQEGGLAAAGSLIRAINSPMLKLMPFISYFTSLISKRYAPRPSITAQLTASTTKSKDREKVPAPIRLYLSPSTP